MLFNKLQILWATIVAVGVALWTTEVSAYTKITGMKALILHVKNPIPSVTEALDAYGIDYVEWDVSGLGEKETLTPKLFDKRPLYYMIIIDGSLEVYDESENSWKSVLTPDQWSELDDYEASHRVRRVVVNQYPKPRSSDSEWGGYEKGQVLPQQIVCADNDSTHKIFNEARVRRSAPLTSEGLIHSNVEYSEDDGVIPILYFKPNDIIIKKTLAAAIFDIGDGREVLTFFLQFSSESITTTILNHLWITWASRGLIPGYRRVLFTPQVENVFLSTSVIDDSLPVTTELKDALTHQYRATAKDYENIMNFMNDLSKTHSLNYGSILKMELVFNGKGILTSNSETNNNKKKRSLNANNKSERDIFIDEINKYWDSRHEEMEKDDLFNFFSNMNHRRKFNWVSNTYSNSVLLDASEQEIVDEILKNIESAMHLGLISRHLENSELWWSKGSIGTRGSLGFTDVKVVNILKKYNIHYGLGNKLRSDIVHPFNSYLPWSSILGDFQVIPRNKRLLLRWATTPKESVWLYNKYHNETTSEPLDHILTKTNKKKRAARSNNDGEDEAWFNVLEAEANEAVLSLLKLKHDPFVFNQSNLKVLSDGSSSIVSEWIDITLQKLNSYVYWPMFSYKSDDLGTYYKLRSLRRECGSEFHYSHNETHILGIEVSSNQPCVVPITVTGDIVQTASDPNLTFEKVGTDPLTVWVTVPGDNTSKIINLNPPLSYFDKTIVHFYGEESFEPDSGIEGDDEEEEKEEEEIEIIEVKKEGEDEGEVKEEILLKDENQEILIATSSKHIKNVQKPAENEKENLKDAMEKILNS